MAIDKVTECLNYLESQGFYVFNMWHVQDVQTKFDCTDEEAQELLEKAVSGEVIIEMINDRISTFGDEMGLKPK